MGLTGRVLIGLGAGLVVGVVLATWGGTWTETVIGFAAPVGQIWINAIRMTVVPLVVSLLFTGIASTSDLVAIGRIGGRAVLLFGISVVAVATVATAVSAPLLGSLSVDPAATAVLRESAGLGSGSIGAASQIPSFAQWIVALVPVNPIASAAEGALLPLILFTIAFAVAATRISAEPRKTLVTFFAGVGDAMLVLVQWVLVAAPVGVFALAIPLGARVGIGGAEAFVYYIALVAALCSTVIVVFYVAAALLGGVPFQRLARALAPVLGVAFGSRSSLAALPIMIREASSTLALPASATGLFLPLAVSLLRVTAPIGMVVGVLFLARVYGVELGTGQLVTIALLSSAMSFSVPGIPGAAIIIMVPILLAVGVPVEGAGLLLAIDTVPDMFRTAGNVTAHLTLATVSARDSKVQDCRP